MNLFSWFILAALLLDLLLQGLASYLNLKALRGDPLPQVADLYEGERWKRTRDYLVARLKLGWTERIFDTALLLAFWFLKGFPALDRIAPDLGLGELGKGLSFLAALLLGKAVLGLPFQAWSTFVVEEKFGFNRTTPKTFFLDRLKALLLFLVLGLPLLAGILAFFLHAGRWAWLYCWGAVTLFSLFIQYIAPTWIFPLFHKFTPIEKGTLEEKIRAYAEKIGFPLQGIYVADGSRRSGKANAFFTGFGRNKRIVLFDTLLQKHTEEEILAVLAHEMGHYKERHILKGTLLGILHTGILFFLLSLFLQVPGLHRAFFMERITVHGALVFFGLLYAPVELLLSLFFNYLSRLHEYQADRFAAETLGSAAPLAAALKKLSADHLSHPCPHPMAVALSWSHPPLLHRLRRLGPGSSNPRPTSPQSSAEKAPPPPR